MLSRFPRRADALLFAAVALAGLLAGAVGLAGSLRTVGDTFPGFVVWDDLVVVALGRPRWTGMAAAVPYRSQVTAVDGRPVRDRGELAAIVRAAPPGTLHRYAFADRDGTTGTRTIAAMRFGRWDWVATMGPYAVNGVVFLLTGLAVFWLDPAAPQARALLAFGAVWGLTLLLALDLFTNGHLQRLYFVFEALAPAAILHLALRFPEPRAGSDRVLALAWCAGAFVGLAQAWTFGRHDAWLLDLNDGVYLAIAATGAIALASIAVAAARAGRPLARRRARVVLAGAVMGFGVPMVAMLAFFLLGQPVSFSLLAVTGLLFPLSVGYAVARHDLFEADRFVKRSLGWALMTAMVSLAYGTTVVVADRVAAEFQLHRSPIFPVIFVLLALATLVPLRDRVQRWLDRLFARGRVSYKEAIARASEGFAALLERDAIVRHLDATMRDAIFVEGGLWERDGEALVARSGGHAGRIEAAPGTLAALERLGRRLSRDEVEGSARLRGVRTALLQLMDQLDAVLVVPLRHQERLLAVLAVAGTASGRPLSADDVDVLETLAAQAALALTNAAAAAQLQDARERLARSERLAAIGELSAAVAHGIRNPLAGIRLAAQLGLEGAAADDPVRENLTDVLTEVDKLEAQVRGILDFARPFEPRLEALRVDTLVESLLQTLASRLGEAHVSTAVAVPADLPAVLADGAHLRQALQELVVNAIEAMPGGGRLTVSAEALCNGGPPRVRIAVSDTGRGVPPEIADRIFQLFMTTKPTGTGVGLAVVRKILERHGGAVHLERVDGGGTRFVVELPVAG